MRVLATILIAAGLPLSGIGSAAADTQGNLDYDTAREEIGRWLAERRERFGASGTLQYELARIKSSMRVYDVTL